MDERGTLGYLSFTLKSGEGTVTREEGVERVYHAGNVSHSAQQGVRVCRFDARL